MQPTLFPSNILPRTIFMRNCSHSVQLPRQFCKIGSRECKEETGTGQKYRPVAEQAREYKVASRTGQGVQGGRQDGQVVQARCRTGQGVQGGQQDGPGSTRWSAGQAREYKEASRTGQEYRPGSTRRPAGRARSTGQVQNRL
jgi:hypothetical protein